MMFLDGDSMLVPMLARSLASGQESDWGMSAVLFVPELALYLIASVLPLETSQLQIIAAILNLLCLYLVFRLAARWLIAAPHRRVVGSFAAYAAYCFLILLEGDGDRNSLELASLLTMTTYYSGTVLAAIITIAAAQRMIDAPGAPGPAVTLVTTSTISTFSNPIFIAWVALPLVVATLVSARSSTWRPVKRLTALLLASAAFGYLARLPLDYWVIASGDNYFHADHASQSFAYYADLFGARAASASGVISFGVIACLLITTLVLSVSSWRRDGVSGSIVCTYGWLAPLSTTLGFILLGTEAARYLQVWIFAPIMGILVATDRLPAMQRTVPWPRLLKPISIFSAGVLAIGLAAAAIPTAVRSAHVADDSLACSVDWVNRSDRVGAGQFWSIRAIKARIAEPSKLLQIDYRMNGYGWLVDRMDYGTDSVSFLVTDAESYPFAFEEPVASAPYKQVDCGKFQILDYGDISIPVGAVWPE